MNFVLSNKFGSATEKQKELLRRLDVEFPANISKHAASSLITKEIEAQKQRAVRREVDHQMAEFGEMHVPNFGCISVPDDYYEEEQYD